VFINRRQAGRQLADRLKFSNMHHPVVYALPRGGVPIAAEIVRALKAPLDVVLVRKLGAPMQPELALGAIVDGNPPTIILNDELIRNLGVSAAQIDEIAAAELTEIRRRRMLYSGKLRPVVPKGRTAIIVDDGMATGATARAAARALREQGASQLVLAVPVAPAEAIAALNGEVDEIICLETPKDFMSVGSHYEDFRQVSTAEVIDLLNEFASQEATKSAPPG
jgi:putative phosphoribosyl transferase